MKEKLFECINVASYFLWEYTKSENALGLWCCVEDIANMLEQNGITSLETINQIIALGKESEKYIEFLRDISYKIFSYTGNIDHIKNWFLSERLLDNEEWKNAVVTIASIYRESKGDSEVIKTIRSETVRDFYIRN